MHLDFSARRVVVVGDLILDRYLEGAVGRLSPEAPVAVLLRHAERDVLGGAANVATNIASLGGQVELLGVCGRDEDGARLTEMLKRYGGIGTGGIVSDDSRPTTCKTRVISGLHQLVRIDSESDAFVSDDVEAALVRGVEQMIDWADAIILSDYAKGVCSDRVVRAVIDIAARHGKASIIDPKRKDFTIYSRATLIKPNRRELSDATRMACGTDLEVEAAARAAIDQTGSSVLLTRSEHGMSYFGVDGEVLHLPTAARDVFDVSGAGDTVVAVTALALASHLSKPVTMRLANAAAGIVVGKVGTAVVTSQELDAVLTDEAHHVTFDKGALVTLEDATRQREDWQRRGLRVGFTNGCYDLLHPGHVTLLQQAAGACDRLIVGINSDASVKRLKGPTRPVQDEKSRAYVLSALSPVDLVVVFDTDTPAEAIAALKPDLLVKGADYTEDKVVGADVVKAAGGQVMLVPLVAGQSTTGLIRRSIGHG